MKNQYLFTSESVSEGHPDKVCDQISDALLDNYIREKPESRVAIETLVTTNLVVLSGEVSNTKISENEINHVGTCGTSIYHTPACGIGIYLANHDFDGRKRRYVETIQF